MQEDPELPDITDARVETDSDNSSNDFDVPSPLPPALLDADEDESDDWDESESSDDDTDDDFDDSSSDDSDATVKPTNSNKCNFVVKVMRPGASEPETVFSESATLENDEDMFAKLKEMTQNTPYGSIISDLVGENAATGLLESNDTDMDMLNSIFGLKPSASIQTAMNNDITNKINDITNKINNDPITSILDTILASPKIEASASASASTPSPLDAFMGASKIDKIISSPITDSVDWGSKFEKEIVNLVLADLLKPTIKPVSSNQIPQIPQIPGYSMRRQEFARPAARPCNCRFCSAKKVVPTSYSRLSAPSYPRKSPLSAPNSFFDFLTPKPMTAPTPTKKSDPFGDILMGLAAVTLLGGTMMLMDSLVPKIKSSADEKTEEEVKKEAENKKNVEAIKAETVKISTLRKEKEEGETFFTPEDFKFFKDHFRDFDGNVDDLSPNFQRMYYEVQDELDDERQAEEEARQARLDAEQARLDAEQAARDAQVDEPYVAPVIGYTSEGKEIRLRQDGMIETDTSVPGWYFNEMYANCSVVKLTNASACHNGFQFVEGLNQDTNEFKYDEECGPDGLYFCREQDAENWFNYGHSGMKYVWDVIIPDDARVCVYDRKVKSDKFILTNQRSLSTLAAEKVRKMVYTDASTSEIISYLTTNFDNTMLNEPEVVEAMVDLIEIRPEAFEQMEDCLRTPAVCAAAARLYDQAYMHMTEADFEDNSGLVLQCVYTNPQIFGVVDDAHKSPAVCAAAFEGDVSNYKNIPEEYKTVHMSKDYLFACPDGTSDVPVAIKNHPEMIDLVLECNPYALKSIEFKNLTKARCLKAVQEEGLVISIVPFVMLNHEICREAVKSSCFAYSSVPLKYRDLDMAATLVNFHPECLADLPADLITLDMIERSVMDSPAHLKKLDFDGIHAPLRELITVNLDILITYEPMIVVYLPKDLVSDEDALNAVEANNNVFWLINQEFTNIDFVVGSVKRGVAFRAIPREYLTMDILIDLVKSRDNLIDEISTRYLSDTLYMAAIDAHNYDHTEIDSQFMTMDLTRFIAAREPESVQAYTKRADELEYELEQSLMMN